MDAIAIANAETVADRLSTASHVCTRRHWFSACAAALAAARTARPAAASRSLPDVVLAQDAPPGIDPAGYLVSEKFDGARALWDGRQLRFRSGLPVQAPTFFTQVLADGGEWLMLHRADAPSLSGRQATLLKLKPLHDAEAEVIGHIAGRGKHAGRLGALRVRSPEGVEFLIGTGFSDLERKAPPPVGSMVPYTHRGFTAAQVPRFASFLRMHGG